MSVENFLQDSRRLLEEEDWNLMEALLFEGEGGADDVPSSNPVFNDCVRFDRNFRNEAAWFRAESAGKDPLDSIRGERSADPAIVEMIHHAAKMKNLLEAERFLDRAKWKFLDEAAGGHYFDFAFLMVYGLKLKILARHQEFNSPKGRKVFDQLKLTKMEVKQ